jgi:hypothetical protein
LFATEVVAVESEVGEELDLGGQGESQLLHFAAEVAQLIVVPE